jgi:hypothetical protein
MKNSHEINLFSLVDNRVQVPNREMFKVLTLTTMVLVSLVIPVTATRHMTTKMFKVWWTHLILETHLIRDTLHIMLMKLMTCSNELCPVTCPTSSHQLTVQDTQSVKMKIHREPFHTATDPFTVDQEFIRHLAMKATRNIRELFLDQSTTRDQLRTVRTSKNNVKVL